MVDLQRPDARVASPQLVAAVKQLWWGAMIVFIDFNVGGWDLSSDILGMTLITWACFQLYVMQASNRFGQAGLILAMVTTLFAVVYSIPSAAERYRWAELVASVTAQVGIVVVAFYVARLLRSDGLAGLAARWDTTARWHAATSASVGVFLGAAYLSGDIDVFSTDSDAVFEWAIASPIGLVTLVVSIALGLFASISWIRAAFAVWK